MTAPSTRFLKEIARSIGEIVNEKSLEGETPSTTEKGSRFCTWVLENYYGVTRDEAENAQEAAGSGDSGIDALFEKDGILYVVQAKYGTSHSASSPIVFSKQALDLLTSEIPAEGRDSVRAARATIKDALRDGEQIEFSYITQNQFRDNRQIDRLIRDWRPPKQSVRLVYRDLRDIGSRLETRTLDVPEGFGRTVFRLALETRPMEVSVAGTQAYVCSVPLRSLAEFVYVTEPYLYVSNIRQYLKRTVVNKRIEATLANEPNLFWAYNNGLTIMCSSAETDGNEIYVKYPQLLNGCQSAKSIVKFFDNLERPDRESIIGAILVRFIVESDRVRKNDVTRHTNSQNAVRGKDFLALDEFQRNLHDAFARQGIYYEIQRGAYSTLTPAGRLKYPTHTALGGKITLKYVPSLEAIQGYASAFHHIPHVAGSSPSDLLPGGSEYSRVFYEDLHADECWEQFFYPYAIVEYARKYMAYGRGGEGFRRYGKWVFCRIVFAVIEETLRSIDPTVQLEGALLKLLMDAPSFVKTATNLADQALDEFLADSTILRKTDNRRDERRFLQGGCGDAESTSILHHKIERTLSKYGDQLGAEMRRMVPAHISA